LISDSRCFWMIAANRIPSVVLRTIMRARFISTILLVVLASPGALLASPVYIGNSPLLPPTDGVYVSPQDAHAEYDAPGLQVILQDIQHSGFTNIVRTPFAGGTTETFDSTVVGNVSVNGGPLTPISLSGPVQVLLFGYSPGDTGTFNTEMTLLALQSAGGGVQIRESPTKQSTGQTTITNQGNGIFQITSFFDVFTELSLDGGQNWVASVDSTHVDLKNVPLPAAWPLFVSGLGLFALLGWRRKQKPFVS
jgi:hypothetical protein